MRKKKFFFTFSMKNQINPPPPLKKKIHRLIVCDERNVNERTVHHSYRVSRYRVSGFIRNESLFPKIKRRSTKKNVTIKRFVFVLFFLDVIAILKKKYSSTETFLFLLLKKRLRCAFVLFFRDRSLGNQPSGPSIRRSGRISTGIQKFTAKKK